MSSIEPIPQTFPLVDKNGFYTVYFKRFLDNVLQRIGGITGGVYNSLTITSAAVVWDLNNSPNAVVTLNVPTTTISAINLVAGAPPYRITLIQDAVGGRLVAWASQFKFPSGVAPTLSTGANAVDELAFDSDGTNLRFQYGNKDLR